MHKHLWDACLDTLQECCEHCTDLVMRDRTCELCAQQVHSKDRHIRNCVVLFQVELLLPGLKLAALSGVKTSRLTGCSFVLSASIMDAEN